MTERGSPLRVALEGLRRRWVALEPWLRRNGLWLALSAGVAVASGILVFALARSSREEAAAVVNAPADESSAGAAGTPAPAAVATHPPPLAPAGAGAPSADAGTEQERSPNVRVVFKTYPPRRASVMWGGKRLGFIERGKGLVVERPRDSGPMDVVIRSPGYLPVHARAYTFDDAVVDVRITPVDKKDTIYGYREPIPEDAGAPPSL